MKTVFKYTWMVAIMMGLGMGFTACSDDDDDKQNSNEELKTQDPYEKQSQAANDLFRVVSTLAEVDSLPDNWKTATFEPVKGTVTNASQPLVRTLTVANQAEAASLFRTLTGENIADDAATASWSADGVGTVKYTATNSSAETAVIDLSIKQMPRLTQLRLVPAAAMGENGKFTGDPYYHIGDVIKDKAGRYWICVRSAYSPAGKEDTHWVSMQLIDENDKASGFDSNVRIVKEKAGKNGLHKIQQKLANGEETKHLKYFAQLMYLLNLPSQYSFNYAKGGIMEDGLGDLGVQAHPQNYLNNLSAYWNKNNIWDLVLPAWYETKANRWHKTEKVGPDYFKNTFTMLYYGHNFSMFGMGSDCTIYTCQQSGTCLSTQTLGEKTWAYNATATTKYDCTDFVNGTAGSNTNAGYTDAAIVVVQASGKKLNKGKNPGPTNRIAECEDIVVGNKLGFDKEEQPVVDHKKNDDPQVGHIINDKGDVYDDYDAAQIAGSAAMAMIVYIGNGGTNCVTEGTARRFLAIALHPANEGSDTKTFAWGPTDKLCGTAVDQDASGGYQKLIDTRNGLIFTETLVNDKHDHPAAKQSWNYISISFGGNVDAQLGRTNFKASNYFLPATGELVLAMKGMGVWDLTGADFANIGTKINELYDKANVPEECRIPLDGTPFWTSTEASDSQAYVIKISTDGIRFVKEAKSAKHMVFPFILFG
jgi:hypothetical protein